MEESIQIDSGGGKKPRLADTENEGEDNISNVPKGVDIISNMPETIICQILSLLPTKDVLRTCVLSKDWEYKWTGIYNVDINDVQRFSLKTTRKTSVVNFVDRIFILSRNASLKRFRLFCQQKYDARRMVTWISAALMRSVEDLDIVYNFEGVVLPRCLFDCNSLTNLKLQLPCIFRPLQNWFSKLKDLYLAKVEIINEHAPSTSQLMFDFPVLETLEPRECKWLKVDFVEINAPFLTKLNVCSNVFEIQNFQMRISGAKLVKFAVSGISLGIFDLSASSVSCVSVDFMSFACDLQGIRRNGQHVRLLLKGCLGLNHLQLLTDIMEWDCDDYDYDLLEPIPSCIASHLNEVEFNGFKGLKPHVHLADFFLKNAAELKKMSGLFRKKCEERRAEKNFWARLKKVFGDGNFQVDSEIKIVDFRSYGHDLQGIRKNASHACLLLKGCSSLNHLQQLGDIVLSSVKSGGCPLPKLNMLKRLELLTICKSKALLELLHMMPFLKSIILDMWMWKDCKYVLVESIPSCIVSHLKEVEFHGFKGKKSHVHLADIFLKNAVELRKKSDGDFELDSWIKKYDLL